MNRILLLSASFLLVAVPFATSLASAMPQIVSVCVKGETSTDCYGGHDVCIQFSEEIPFCQDVPGTISCGWPVCGAPRPVQVCTGSDPCAGGHTFCIVIDLSGPWITFVEPIPICGDCECIPAFATADPRAASTAALVVLP